MNSFGPEPKAPPYEAVTCNMAYNQQPIHMNNVYPSESTMPQCIQPPPSYGGPYMQPAPTITGID